MKLSIFYNNVLLAVPALCSASIKPKNPFDITASDPLRPRYSEKEAIQLLRSLSDEKFPILQRRNTNSTNTTITQPGTVSLATDLNNDKLLSIGAQLKQGVKGGTTEEDLSLSVTCVSCYTTGSGSVIIPALHTSSEALQVLEDIGESILLFLDPLAAIALAVSGGLNITLSNLSGHFEFDIALDAEGTYTYEVFSIEIPGLGVGLDGNDIGIQFAIELVFDVQGSVNFTTGFDLSFPEDVFFAMDLFKGELTDRQLGNFQFSPVPFDFIEGQGDFSISLRASIEAGLGIDIAGFGFNVDAGVSIDLPTYQASITYDPSAECELDFVELVAIEAGAFATAALEVDYLEKTAGPSKGTTFISQTLPGTCIASQTSLPPTSGAPTLAAASTVTATVTPVALNSSTASVTSTTISNYTTSFSNYSTSLPIHSQLTITNGVNITTLATPAVGDFAIGTPVSGASIGSVKTVISTVTPSFTAIANATLSSLLRNLTALAPSTKPYIVVTTAPTITSTSVLVFTPPPTTAQLGPAILSAGGFNTPTATPTSKSGVVGLDAPSMSAIFMLFATLLFFICFP